MLNSGEEGTNMNAIIKLFRVISYSEGISFLLLLGIAMPLKYVWDMPLAVTIIGALHGLLFVVYLISLAFVMWKMRWSIWIGLLGVLASILPFGPFLFDAKYVK